MPVLDRAIEIVQADDEVVIVNKPCSLPVSTLEFGRLLQAVIFACIVGSPMRTILFQFVDVSSEASVRHGRPSK